MKIHADTPEAQSITGYGPGWIGIGNEKITESVILSSRGLRIAWPCAHFEDLTPEHFAQLAPLEAELVIFGSGTRTRFAKPQWLQPLIARRPACAVCRDSGCHASSSRICVRRDPVPVAVRSE